MGDETALTLINKLDFSDPLYLHPSDTTGTPLVSVKLKGTENYNIWSRSVLLALGTKNKVGFIDGTCVKNTTDDVLARQWDRCNSVVLTWSNLLLRDPLPNVKTAYSVISREESHRSVINGSSNMNLTNDQMMRLLSLINEKNPVNEIANDNMADSGANQHMTDSIQGLTNVFDVTYLNLTVGHPNGTKALIRKIGDLNLTKNIVLHNVLVIPEYCDLKLGTIVGTGDMYDGLYVFDAKQTRDSFPLSDHKTTSLGELVHLDLWGHFKVQSRDGFKYFLTVVDDFSRCVWIYLIKHKDEVTHQIKSFVSFLETQFSKQVKTFRSDIGSEFVNNQTNEFFNSKGILHQTSCVYTPQQNGIVEKKHRHLLNVARALMFQGGIPLNMWSDCVLTACYLINRTPSSVLSGLSPYEVIFKKTPSLSQLRVFGCLCYAVDLKPKHKFSSSQSNSLSPNDEERDISDGEGSSGTCPLRDECPTDGNASDTCPSSDECPISTPLDNSTSPEGTSHSEPVVDQNLRRSTRETNIPKKFDDYVFEGKVKYGVERVVNYSMLNSDN
ncbi:uncharacterized protein [Rutidosis leptorrhynchoides]|uniref:uncharacterized protein n=1 Tax=Rutidosis leptorrhynchoides TaxID=125765 RepID=UPI003A9A6588